MRLTELFLKHGSAIPAVGFPLIGVGHVAQGNTMIGLANVAIGAGFGYLHLKKRGRERRHAEVVERVKARMKELDDELKRRGETGFLDEDGNIIKSNLGSPPKDAPEP